MYIPRSGTALSGGIFNIEDFTWVRGTVGLCWGPEENSAHQHCRRRPKASLFLTAPLPQDVLVRHPSPTEGLRRWLSSKESAFKAGDPVDSGSIPGSGRSPGEGNGNPLQFSCLGNHTDRGARQTTVHGVSKSRTQLSNYTFYSVYP